MRIGIRPKPSESDDITLYAVNFIGKKRNDNALYVQINCTFRAYVIICGVGDAGEMFHTAAKRQNICHAPREDRRDIPPGGK